MTSYLVGEVLHFENTNGEELELEIIDIFDYDGDIIFCLSFEGDDTLFIMKAIEDVEDTFDPVNEEEYDILYEMYVQRASQLFEDSKNWS